MWMDVSESEDVFSKNALSVPSTAEMALNNQTNNSFCVSAFSLPSSAFSMGL